jgi:hypothetical protein
VRHAAPSLITFLCMLALCACGGAASVTPSSAPPGPPSAPAAAPNAAATETRAVELAQLATVTAPTATPDVAATQTRTAELSQIATLTVPSATAVAQTGTTTFVGRAQGSEAFVAVVADGARATAYVCDSASLAVWFSGSVQDGQVDLTNDEGERLTVDLGQGGGGRATLARGSVRTAEGTNIPFSTARVADNGQGGLYRAQVGGPPPGGGESPRVGVIVLDSGEFRGAYWADEQITPVTEVRLGAGSLDAMIPGVGTIATVRLSAPLGGRAARIVLFAPVVDQRRRAAG